MTTYVDGKIVCDECRQRPPVRNYQKVWIRWRINPKTGDYSSRPIILYQLEEPVGLENRHLCLDCSVKFENGII